MVTRQAIRVCVSVDYKIIYIYNNNNNNNNNNNLTVQFGLPCHKTSRDGFIFHARNLNGNCFSKRDLILLVVAVSFC